MSVNNRPVRLYPRLMEDIASPDKGDAPSTSGLGSLAAEEEAKLQALSTEQLRALAKKEKVGVSLRLGRGARERFIRALIDKRVYEWPPRKG